MEKQVVIDTTVQKKNITFPTNTKLRSYQRVVNQKRLDKNKIHSLHEPGVSYIGKGKKHKKYEFGARAGMTKTSCILVGAKSFSRNEYDGDTLKTILPQIEAVHGQIPETVLYSLTGGDAVPAVTLQRVL